jgi:DNA-binding response OmpR family regulator
MPENVLVIEDDDRIRTVLQLALEDEGYEVTGVSSAEAGIAAMRSSASDYLIVDLMLGGMDGFTCIREVRRWSDVPIVIVSARRDTHDVVAGLEAGADDYVTKPFQVKEITARMRALRRRLRPREIVEKPFLVLREEEPALVLRPSEGRLLRGEEPVHLTLTEFRLLCELAETPGRVLSRRQLLERVWDRGFFGDERLVDVHVRRLRTKVEMDPAVPRIVVTVRGLGYRLETC